MVQSFKYWKISFTVRGIFGFIARYFSSINNYSSWKKGAPEKGRPWKREHQFEILKIKLRLTNWQWFWYSSYLILLLQCLHEIGFWFLVIVFVEWFLWYILTFSDLDSPLISCSNKSTWRSIKKSIIGDWKNCSYDISGFVVWLLWKLKYFRGSNLPLGVTISELIWVLENPHPLVTITHNIRVL